jgi:hypothetical protein
MATDSDNAISDGSCCPSCCNAADLGTHDYCLPCGTNPTCSSAVKADRGDVESGEYKDKDKDKMGGGDGDNVPWGDGQNDVEEKKDGNKSQ